MTTGEPTTTDPELGDEILAAAVAPLPPTATEEEEEESVVGRGAELGTVIGADSEELFMHPTGFA